MLQFGHDEFLVEDDGAGWGRLDSGALDAAFQGRRILDSGWLPKNSGLTLANYRAPPPA